MGKWECRLYFTGLEPEYLYRKVGTMTKLRNPIFILVALLLTGCASVLPKKGIIFERQGVSTLLVAPEMREIYFNDQSSSERHCQAPGPDASIESSSGISFGASVAGNSDTLSDKSGQAGLAFGGRNPAVLIARELMYRACELSSNLNADQKTTLFIYERFLQSIEKSFLTQTGSGSITASDSTSAISLAEVVQATEKTAAVSAADE